MIEVCPNLCVGSEHDEQRIRGQAGWFFIHACKEPYHRQALGYTGRAAAKTHPEYLIARRNGRLILISSTLTIPAISLPRSSMPR